MSYKSPIELFQTEAYTEICKKKGKYILKAVQDVGVNVDKKELIKALNYDRQQYEKGYADGINADKWISVKDRLPDNNVEVLIVTDSKFISIDRTYNGVWKKFRHTTHWQPIPRPPIESEV